MQNNLENFSPEDSILLIQSMIEKTKSDYSGRTIFLLLWGWLVFAACVIQYILLKVFHSPYSYWAWSLMWVGLIITIIIIVRKKNEPRIKTYVGDSMRYLWTGVGITFVVVGFLCAINGWVNAFPLYIMLYGTGTFISGSIIRFRLLLIGGICCWIIAIVAAMLPYDWQILATAFSILIAYIIPGHLLHADYKKKKNADVSYE